MIQGPTGLTELPNAETWKNLYDRNNVELRVKWINALRVIVGRRIPKNKAGASLTSDVDLVLSTLEEQQEAVSKISEIKL